MAVKIRLKRTGKKKAPSYRVVIADARSPRDGRIIENIGWYNPRVEPSAINIDEEKALGWLKNGAQPTESVASLLKRTGILERFEQQRSAATATAPAE
jgi:small subunit ribosomal protein S16